MRVKCNVALCLLISLRSAKLEVSAVALRSENPWTIPGATSPSASYHRSSGAASLPLFSSRRNDDFGGGGGGVEGGGKGGHQQPQHRPYATEAAVGQKTDRPTQTAAAIIGAPSLPAKPKIVVLGATGGVGRHVIRQLMATGVDMTVVAFCRNYDKALETLYEGAEDSDGDGDGPGLVMRRKRRGPRLEIIVADLVDKSSVFNYRDDDDEVEVEFNSTTLASVRRFYGEDTANEVYRASSQSNDDFEAHELLKAAIKDCTAIISCVGTVRPTNPWTDYVLNPLRIFRKDASRWCSDPRHPYYVNYLTTRDALDLAEKEQRRREVEVEQFEMAEEEMAKEAAEMGRSYLPADGRDYKKRGRVERIKFVRISDLAVSIHPWKIVSLFTNIGRSLVFRDQERCEMLLEESDLVDTITLRPGDLIDGERDSNTTSLQLDASGELPYPAIVSREDVAAVAVAAALTRKDRAKAVKQTEKSVQEKASSYTWALRWAGSHLEQGRKSDGLPDAQACVDRMFKLEKKRDMRRKRVEETRNSDSLQRLLLTISKPLRKRRLKPYGIAVAVPVYMVMAAIILTALRNVPGKEIVLKLVVKRLGGGA